MDNKIINKLDKRRREGTLRSLSVFDGFNDFYSNDYLGYAREKQLASLSGSTGSRLISGTTDSMLNAELKIANFFGAEAGLMFNSGYDANLGFFSAVPQRGDLVLYDELIHASVRDGIRLGFADSKSFGHNDVEALRVELSKAAGQVYVAIESLYSMDGDLARLKEISNVCNEFGADLVVDEAHACGVYGDQGKGLVCQYELESQVFARLVTFGKAYGSHGGIILGSKTIIEYMINFARSFIYTTALPEAVYKHNAEVISSGDRDERFLRLNDVIATFRKAELPFRNNSDDHSPIQILETGDVVLTKKLAQRLQEAKLAVKPIFSPTVPAGKERLRICLHAFNTIAEVDQLTRLLLQ